MSDEPFGRQPKPVKVTLQGERIDVDHYISRLIRAADSHGEMIVRNGTSFTIYPRAVND